MAVTSRVVKMYVYLPIHCIVLVLTGYVYRDPGKKVKTGSFLKQPPLMKKMMKTKTTQMLSSATQP